MAILPVYGWALSQHSVAPLPTTWTQTSPTRPKHPISEALARPEPPQTMTRYLGPVQALGIFAAGVASAFAAKGFYKALKLPPVSIKLGKPPAQRISDQPGVRTEENAGMYFTGGNIPSALMLAAQFPEVRQNMMGFVWASILGYGLASAATGVKEVLVRQEETQIRADLLQKLTATFDQSLRQKRQQDQALKTRIRAQATQILQGANIPLQGEDSLGVSLLQRQYRYPGEPVHFNLPEATCFAGRFGTSSALEPSSSAMGSKSPWPMWELKGALFTLGVAVGSVLQLLPKVLQPTGNTPSGSAKPVKTVLKAYNTSGLETLFLLGTKAQLWGILGLVTLGKAGKMLVDAYREVEVTRKNAQTELTYQRYNWLSLDPQYHNLAETEAAEAGLAQLENLTPYPTQARQFASTLLGNVGRQSTPYYMPMTPMVNLTEARG